MGAVGRSVRPMFSCVISRGCDYFALHCRFPLDNRAGSVGLLFHRERPGTQTKAPTMTTPATIYVTDAIGTIENARIIVADWARRAELDRFRYAVVRSNYEQAQNALAQIDFPVGSAAKLANGMSVTVLRNDGHWGADVLDPTGKTRCLDPRFLLAA